MKRCRHKPFYRGPCLHQAVTIDFGDGVHPATRVIPQYPPEPMRHGFLTMSGLDAQNKPFAETVEFGTPGDHETNVAQWRIECGWIERHLRRDAFRQRQLAIVRKRKARRYARHSRRMIALDMDYRTIPESFTSVYKEPWPLAASQPRTSTT